MDMDDVLEPDFLLAPTENRPVLRNDRKDEDQNIMVVIKAHDQEYVIVEANEGDEKDAPPFKIKPKLKNEQSYYKAADAHALASIRQFDQRQVPVVAASQ